MLAEAHQTAIISSFLSSTTALKYQGPNGDKTVKQQKNREQGVTNTENKICIVNPNQKQALALCGHQDTHRNNSHMDSCTWRYCQTAGGTFRRVRLKIGKIRTRSQTRLWNGQDICMLLLLTNLFSWDWSPVFLCNLWMTLQDRSKMVIIPSAFCLLDYGVYIHQTNTNATPN